MHDLSYDGNPMSESSVKFRSVVRGYDPVQVDQHMNELARAAASIWQEAGERTHQINELKDENSQLRSQAESHSQRALDLEEAMREAEAPSYAGLGDRIGAVLTLVQNEAHELRTRAGAGRGGQQPCPRGRERSGDQTGGRRIRERAKERGR